MNPVTLADLWLPIVVSAVVVFFASFVAWALSPHHKADWKSTGSAEAELMRVVKGSGLGPGQYVFPHMEDCKSEEAKQKLKEGCMGALTVFSGSTQMGKKMALSVVVNLVICALIGYIALQALPRGAEYLSVFRFVSAASLLGYYTGGLAHGVWFGRPLRNFITDFADAAVYSLLTAGIFSWLWPVAAVPTLP